MYTYTYVSLSELFNAISRWREREREALISSIFAYANRHIIIDQEEKRVAYDANWYGQTTHNLHQAEMSLMY